jgi:hypothetical protein
MWERSAAAIDAVADGRSIDRADETQHSDESEAGRGTSRD